MSPSSTDNIATRSSRGSVYALGASAITTVSGFIRSIILARLLPPEYFGTVVLALFFLSLSAQIQHVGLNRAFIHKDDNSPVHVGTYFTLRVGLTSLTILITLIMTPIIIRIYPEQPLLGPVLIALAFLEIIVAFNSVATTMFSKELHFKRLAGVDMMSSISMTIITPLAVLAGFGIWSLVVERYVGAIFRLAGLWAFKRPWRVHFAFDREQIRWYFNFGKHIYANANLALLLDRFDDFWTGTFLGDTALGYYSKAYEFARYPRRVLSAPLATVFFPTFAKLQQDRLRLSKAFYRVSSLIIRVGFPLFGAFALVAPEFTQIFLGEEWLPIITPLQLMLVYSLIDPLFSIAGNLLSALGQPRLVTRIRVVQLVIFIPLVFVLGGTYGINGVAVAADVMILLGFGLLLRQTRRFADFSARKLFLIPMLGLILGIVVALGLEAELNSSNLWLVLMSKGFILSAVYSAVLLLFERKEYIRNWQIVWQTIRPQ